MSKRTKRSIRPQSKILILSLVLLLALSIISGKFNSSSDSLPTTQNTQKQMINNSKNVPTDWNTYINEKYKFSFKYPADWVYDDSDSRGKDFKIPSSGYQLILGKKTLNPGKDDPITSGPINIEIYNRENYVYFKSDLLDKYINDNIVSKKETLINNITVYEIHNTSCRARNDCISVVFEKNGNIFHIDTWVWDTRYVDLNTIYKIISTLQFEN